MAEQMFSVGEAPRIVITTLHGELSVNGWNEQSVRVETDSDLALLHTEGDTLTIGDCYDDLELHVPQSATIIVETALDDVAIRGVRHVELGSAAGDVELHDIHGDGIQITNVAGDFSASNVSAVHVHSIGSDADFNNVALVEVETVGGDLSVQKAEAVLVGTVGGDMSAREVVATLRFGVLGSDGDIEGGTRTEVTIGNVGGDLSVGSAASVQVGNVGSDCSLRDIQGDVDLGFIGSDLDLKGVGGNLQIGQVGSDASLKGIQGNIEIGSIGSDLSLQATFVLDSVTRFNVGGDAVVSLPDNPNLSIQANVGGEISGKAIVSSRSGNMVNLVYGEGAAHLELNVGGDLELRGAGGPRSSSSSSGGNWAWNDFGAEMADFGREMSRLGQDLGRQIADAFKDVTWEHGSEFANDLSQHVEERVREAKQRVEDAARRASEQASRHKHEHSRHRDEHSHHRDEREAGLHVRIKDREWHMDPERLERIKDHARRAATEGISGAMEAVERAISNLGVPTPPKPPTPPNPPFGSVPPVPPTPPSGSPPIPPKPPVPPTSSFQAGTSQTAVPNPKPAVDIEQEREAILRMIAEGRVTPEEGDMLLEALG